jgi:PKD repeat protein
MKSRNLLVLLVLLMTTRVFAAPVNQEIASRLAANFYMERSNGVPFAIAETRTISHGSMVLLYLFNGIPGGGYVIVSGDDGAYPVPGYSLSLNYDFDTLNHSPAFRAMMRSFALQIQTQIDYSLPATQEATQAWNHYGVSSSLFSPASPAAVPPLLGSIAWGQGCYYNADCPYDLSAGSPYCNRALVGCVATAMSQIMKYWSYPAQGIGSKTYIHPTYGSLSANFASATYNWASMPNVANAHNTSLALINYHAGVSVEMNYGPASSGAFPTVVRDAMVNNFGYQTGANFKWQAPYSTAAWESMLKADLDNSKPVFYCGYEPFPGQGGHAWVIDGYQGSSNNHFHCNWGWNGYQNGYFYLSGLIAGGNNFTADQGAVFGIEPPVIAPPTADFSAANTNLAVGIPVAFTNLSTGNSNAWKWFFGDGDSSTLQHPSHPYLQPGTFTVTLIAYNQIGSDTMVKVNYISTFLPPAPVALFFASPLQLPMGSPVQFTDQSSNAPSAWLWDFGDGQTSMQQNPQHVYQSVGVFTVKLVVSNFGGTDSLVIVNYITTTPAPPSADFSASPLFIYPGDTVFFTDLSGFLPDSWLWQFGDGDSSLIQHPWHIYSTTGVYTVSLRTSNTYGFTEMIKPYYIYVMPLPPRPMAWFAADQTTILTGQSVLFTDYSTSMPLRWEWTFPGGTPGSSAQQHPGSVIYNAYGSYDVQLVVWNVTGSDTLLRRNFITVGALGIDQPMVNEINVFPVPARDVIFIAPSYSYRSVMLRDLSGRLLLKPDASGPAGFTYQLDVSQIPPGLYLLEVSGEDNHQMIKVLIVR